MARAKSLTIVRGQDPSPLVTVGDVAARLGVTVGLVGHWVKRPWLETPEPIAVTAAGAVFWYPDWVQWAAVRRPDLKVQQ